MDNWICDDSFYISRKSGTSDGVVQVYKHTFPNSPTGDYSFSLIGETDTPSAIAPSLVWERSAYLRLIEFLELNSAMVTASGHLIVRSQIRIAGRDDGPTAYWRCLDLLPMHTFGLIKPLDTGKRPKFLIIGGEVEKSVSDDGGWKSKYDKLDADYTTLTNKYDDLNDGFTTFVLQKIKLVRDVEAYEAIKHELDVLKDEIKDLKITNMQEATISKDTISKLQDKLDNSMTKTVANQLMMQEVDIWSKGIAKKWIIENVIWGSDKHRKDGTFVRECELPVKSFPLEDARFCGEYAKFGNWKVYVYKRTVTFILYRSNEAVARHSADLQIYNSKVFGWDSKDSTRRLCGSIRISV